MLETSRCHHSRAGSTAVTSQIQLKKEHAFLFKRLLQHCLSEDFSAETQQREREMKMHSSDKGNNCQPKGFFPAVLSFIDEEEMKTF